MQVFWRNPTLNESCLYTVEEWEGTSYSLTFYPFGGLPYSSTQVECTSLGPYWNVPYICTFKTTNSRCYEQLKHAGKNGARDWSPGNEVEYDILNWGRPRHIHVYVHCTIEIVLLLILGSQWKLNTSVF